MPLDALTLGAVRRDLARCLLQARLDRIFQPGRSELVFVWRRGNEQYRMQFGAEAPGPWLGLVDSSPENPATPPAFCMLLRKYLSGGRLLRLVQPPFERRIALVFEHYDELVGLAERALHLELMGRRGNAVLTEADGTVLDALWRTAAEAPRPLEPGARYQPPPPAPGRLNPDALAEGTFRNLLAFAPPDLSVAGLLTGRLLGIGPPVAAGLLDRAGVPGEKPAAALVEPEIAALWGVLSALAAAVRAGEFAPGIVRNAAGEPVSLLAFPAPVPAGHVFAPVTDAAVAAGAVFGRAAALERLGRRRRALALRVQAEMDRTARKRAKQEAELASAREADRYRRHGELLLAHLSEIPRGAREISLPALDGADERVVVPLDPSLAPSANAQAYFRRYQRAKRGQTAIAAQLARTEETLAYLAELSYSITAAETEAELREIEAEIDARNGKAESKARLPSPAGPRRFRSADGLEILVGRNNRQNEQVTFALAGPADTWLHARNIPGAHVIIRQGGAARVPQATLLDAANLAVYYSQARAGTKVPVDYTQRRHVRKRPGGHPGLVHYDRFQTLIVDPDREILDRLLAAER